MQLKLLNDLIGEIGGKSAADLVDLLFGKRDVNEFLLAKKLGLTINQTRNVLYKLSNFNLVTFTRKKDKRRGWYTYFWTLDNVRCLELLENKLKKEIDSLRQKLITRRQRRFFECPTCKVEVSEETALQQDFACRECGQVYVLSDNQKIIVQLEKDISRLENQLKSVAEELVKAKEEIEKKSKRKAKKVSKKRKVKKKAKKVSKKKAKKRVKKKKK